MKYKGLLFIDIDGTFLRWSLFLYMVERLIDAGIFPSKVRAGLRRLESKWRNRKGSYEDYLQKAIDIFESRIAGVDIDRFERLARQTALLYKDQIYIYTRDLISKKIKSGWYVVAISCSPIELVKPFGRAWGIHEVFGAVQERAGNKYTGVRFLPRAKDKIANQIMARPEFAHIRKQNIWGIGDTEGDATFLRLMGRAVCFNPTRELYSAAKKHGWKVVVERKNVVYEL